MTTTPELQRMLPGSLQYQGKDKHTQQTTAKH